MRISKREKLNISLKQWIIRIAITNAIFPGNASELAAKHQSVRYHAD